MMLKRDNQVGLTYQKRQQRIANKAEWLAKEPRWFARDQMLNEGEMNDAERERRKTFDLPQAAAENCERD